MRLPLAVKERPLEGVLPGIAVYLLKALKATACKAQLLFPKAVTGMPQVEYREACFLPAGDGYTPGSVPLLPREPKREARLLFSRSGRGVVEGSSHVPLSVPARVAPLVIACPRSTQQRAADWLAVGLFPAVLSSSPRLTG